MTNPVVFKQTLPVGLLSLAQAIALPMLAAAILIVEAWFLKVPIESHFALLLTLIIALGALLLQPERGVMSQLVGARAQMITRIAVRLQFCSSCSWRSAMPPRAPTSSRAAWS